MLFRGLYHYHQAPVWNDVPAISCLRLRRTACRLFVRRVRIRPIDLTTLIDDAKATLQSRVHARDESHWSASVSRSIPHSPVGFWKVGLDPTCGADGRGSCLIQRQRMEDCVSLLDDFLRVVSMVLLEVFKENIAIIEQRFKYASLFTQDGGGISHVTEVIM